MSTPVENNTEGLLDILNAVRNLPDAGGGSSPYAKAAEFTWEAPYDIKAATGAVAIAHDLGDVPDGYVLSCVEFEYDGDDYIVPSMSFDRSMYHAEAGIYLSIVVGMQNLYMVNGYFGGQKYSDLCTSTDIKVGVIDIRDDAALIIPAGKQYRVLVYKR